MAMQYVVQSMTIFVVSKSNLSFASNRLRSKTVPSLPLKQPASREACQICSITSIFAEFRLYEVRGWTSPDACGFKESSGERTMAQMPRAEDTCHDGCGLQSKELIGLWWYQQLYQYGLCVTREVSTLPACYGLQVRAINQD